MHYSRSPKGYGQLDRAAGGLVGSRVRADVVSVETAGRALDELDVPAAERWRAAPGAPFLFSPPGHPVLNGPGELGTSRDLPPLVADGVDADLADQCFRRQEIVLEPSRTASAASP